MGESGARSETAGRPIFSRYRGSHHCAAPTWTDVDGDGVFNPNLDRKIVGTANPDFFGGLTNTVTYKNFDLMFFLQYSYLI